MKRNQPLVIGVTGMPRCGKGTVINFLTEIINDIHPKCKVVRLSTGDGLVKTARMRGISASRSALQALAVTLEQEALEQGDSPGVISLGMFLTMRARRFLKVDIIFYDAVRWFSDVGVMRLFRPNILLSVERDRTFRYHAAVEADEKTGDAEKSWLEFLEEDNAPSENLIPTISANADVHICNNMTLEYLRTETEDMYECWIASHLQKKR